MILLLAPFLLIAAILTVAMLYLRVRELERKFADSERLVQKLVQRVFKLETDGQPPKPAPILEAQPVTPVTPPTPAPRPSPMVYVDPPRPDVEPPPRPVVDLPPQPEPIPIPVESSSEGWEARLGGSWLNKIGVLVLVIGIALFLGYSLTSMGPATRVTVGYLVALSLLGCGIAAERSDSWRLYAYGLIGGGWAALYLTTYAMYALPAARLIDDPTVAMILLLVVAAGMILHSLRYRSQTVTGVAYSVAFVTLSLQPLSMFARVASIPLVASALYVAFRFRWLSMQIGAVALSYGAYVLRDHPDSPLHAWVAGRPVLWVYWLMFEAFALARRQRGPALFMLNACGFVAATFLARPELDRENIDLFLPVAAGVFLASALIRAWLPGQDDETAADTGYEAPVTVSAVLVTAALARRFSGEMLTLALLALAQMIVMAGLQLRSRYLRGLGALAFVIPFYRLVLDDVSGTTARVLGIGSTALFYFNRWLLRREDRSWNPVYSYAGATIAAFLIQRTFDQAYWSAGWIAAAFVLLEVGLFTRVSELRYQAGGLAVLSLAMLAVIANAGYGRAWISLGVPALLSYAAAFHLAWLRSDRVSLGLSFSSGTAFLTTLLWALLPRVAVAPAWAALALVLLFVGVRFNQIGVRVQAALLTMSAFLNVWAVQFDGAGGLRQRILPVVCTVALFYIAQFVVPRSATATLDRLMRPGYSILATILLAALLGQEVSGRLLTVAWGLQGVLLLGAGFVTAERILRIAGLVLFLFCILKLFLFDARELDTLSRIMSFIVLGILLLGASWIYTRFRSQIRRYL